MGFWSWLKSLGSGEKKEPKQIADAAGSDLLDLEKYQKTVESILNKMFEEKNVPLYVAQTSFEEKPVERLEVLCLNKTKKGKKILLTFTYGTETNSGKTVLFMWFSDANSKVGAYPENLGEPREEIDLIHNIDAKTQTILKKIRRIIEN